MFPATIVAFALVSVVVVIGQALTNCPNFVPTTEDTSACAGAWFLSQTMAIGIPTPKRKCWTKNTQVNRAGTFVSKESLVDIETDFTIPYTTTGTPLDHVRSRLAELSKLEPNNAEILTILKIEPSNYYITALCRAVEDTLGYKIDVFSAKNELDESTLNTVKEFLKNAGLQNNLTKVDQTKCPGT